MIVGVNEKDLGLKIALFPPSLEVGGVQRVVLNLARGFSEAGIETDIVVIKAEGAFLSQIPPNVNVVNLKSKRALASVLPLARYLQRERPDVLLAASEPVNLAAIWAKMLARTQTRIGVLVLNTPSVRNANVLFKREKVYPFLTRLFYPHADYVVAIAESIRQDLSVLIGLSVENIEMIHTPILTPDFFKRSEVVMEYPWLQDDDCPIIMDVARFVPAKDLPTLIRAFALVCEQRAARLVIVGDGPDRPQIENLVAELGLEDHVFLPGFLDNLPLMKHADVFVLSSIFEGLPTVLIEALALCTAIVSTDSSGGAKEILDNGRCGRFVPVQDPPALAQAIIESLDDPIDTTILRQRANDFSMERIINQYRALLNLS